MLLFHCNFYKKTAVFLISSFLIACSASPKLIKQEGSYININIKDSIKEDASIKQLIEPYKQDLEKEMSEVLITSQTVFDKGQPEGTLGNLVADIIFQKGNERYRPEDSHLPDFCLLNNGGLRVSLPEGEITRGKIFELMPFENEIVIVTLSGVKVDELINYIITVKGQPVSELQIINSNKPDYSALIKGIPFDKNKTYKVVTSDYLASGGDKMEFFKNPIKIETTGYKIRDAIIDYLTSEKQKGNTLMPHTGGRITNEQ